ncbi:hypothetical protein A2801_04210 [Candidatus Woesebacteria bacterium RIFCSPHIGHO2_01_FULL_41_10]|uniref:Uncharacterized protein n=1 Tax=Candidatus Woesebacteria bacterium RIFCSPHIGHO2_01_FULL_41_10 TaxID=1802500 RepID=A0A1F7YLI3_9BACT|nr:MAG: hypothetical protein A2801_04210 [Candidatus Woesebacteria bacterium RIFCSPHIGHO2_01_FULL_41_10]
MDSDVQIYTADNKKRETDKDANQLKENKKYQGYQLPMVTDKPYFACGHNTSLDVKFLKISSPFCGRTQIISKIGELLVMGYNMPS